MSISVINKLFRDKLVPQQTAMGWTILCTRLTGQQLADALLMKGEEEIIELKKILETQKQYVHEELKDLQKKIINEAKDLQEVIDTLDAISHCSIDTAHLQHIIDEVCVKYQISKEGLAKAQQLDRKQRGSFLEGRFVKKLEIPEGDERYEYFKNKYPQEDTF